MANLIGEITKEKVPLHGEFEVVEYSDTITFHYNSISGTSLYSIGGSGYINTPLVREGYKPLGIVGVKSNAMIKVSYNATIEEFNGLPYIYYSYSYIGVSKQDASGTLSIKILYVKE